MSYTLTQTELGAGNIQIDVLWSVTAQNYILQSNLQFTQLTKTIFDVADSIVNTAIPDYRLLRPTPATSSVTNNVAAGFEALLSVSGTGNSAFGFASLKATTSGLNNTAVGAVSLGLNVTGNRNTAVGFEAAYLGMIVSDNTAIGYRALRNTTGANNVAIGGDSLLANTTATGNVGIGLLAGANAGTGSENVAIGQQSGIGATSARCVAVGKQALAAMTSATNNVGVGYQAGLALTSGGNNTAVGYQALGAGTGVAKSNHTCIGYNSGIAITTGLQNTLIGSGANVDAGARSRCVNIGYNTISPAVDGSLSIGGAAGDAMGNLISGTAGVHAGQHLVIYLNGTQYKIALLPP